MNKIFWGLLLVGHISEIFSMNHTLDLYPDAVSGGMEIQYDGKVFNLLPNAKKKCCDCFVQNKLEYLLISSLSKSNTNSKIDISSGVIPIVLDSFHAELCRLYAPGVTITGNSAVTNFAVAIVDSDKNILDISGDLLVESLLLRGSTEINGNLSFIEKGLIRSKGVDTCNILINGSLSATENLEIDTSSSILSSKVTNNGSLIAKNGRIFLSIRDFLNTKKGKISGNEAIFRSNGNIENNGLMKFNKFELMIPDYAENFGQEFYGRSFLQKGFFKVLEQATIGCNFEISGPTAIKRLLFPLISNLNITKAKVRIGTILGRFSILNAEAKSDVQIGSIKGGSDAIKSSDSQLSIRKYCSDQNDFFSTKLNGEVIVGEVDSKNSSIHSDSGHANFLKINGNSVVYATGTAKIHIKGGDNLTIQGVDQSNIKIADSHVSEAYLNSENSIKKSSVDFVDNRGKLKVKDTSVNKLKTEGKAVFQGTNEINQLHNSKKAVFKSGHHKVKQYIGDSKEAELKAQGNKKKSLAKTASTLTSDSSSHNSALLKQINKARNANKNYLANKSEGEVHGVIKDGDAQVTFGNISGMSKVKAERQIYDYIIPRGVRTVGGVDVFLDHIPTANEIPLFDGDFRINADLFEDFINTENVDYKGASFALNMHGHKWINKNAVFLAGGLYVDHASIFGNDNGIIGLEKNLLTQANLIFNKALPTSTENGRWVHDTSFWRAHAHFYMPATYYSRNEKTGIFVKGNVVFDASDSIQNNFSSILTKGALLARAGNEFSNTVGTIAAVDDSLIIAPEIFNKDLGTTVRKGEFHAKGRCGWGFGRHTWHHDLYVSETINQSEGARMVFCNTVNFEGHVHNIGSTILGRRIETDIGNVENVDVLENEALIKSMDGLTLPEPKECTDLKTLTVKLWSIE